ncbi:MAG TPA: fumarylacetoacetate hydrolase family protein [Acidimicrobiales bacterium]|jgi:2-keto-4-pentenoate hydratase/2-oxohepta-3-ene-1,7-dioic acid hydratase in catechol pathway
MRIANVAGRAQLIVDSRAVDIFAASGGQFGPDLTALYDNWDAFRKWADTADPATTAPSEPFDPATCGPPSPAPRQVFAVALNYRAHAAESGNEAPSDPVLFAKYVSAFTGPVTEVALPPGHVDWECELVAVVSRSARRIAAGDAWSHVAGLTVGQDLSERVLQRSGPVPQFGLAKSHPGFAPTGPVLVTPDEFTDPDDLELGCEVDGQTMQSARTSLMIFPVPALITYLSTVVTLLPGDVIFTGTPSGVGMGRTPPVFLAPGDHLRSWVEGIGDLHQHFVAP